MPVAYDPESDDEMLQAVTCAVFGLSLIISAHSARSKTFQRKTLKLMEALIAFSDEFASVTARNIRDV